MGFSMVLFLKKKQEMFIMERNNSIVTLSDEILSHLYDLYPVLLRLVPVTETYHILKTAWISFTNRQPNCV